MSHKYIQEEFLNKVKSCNHNNIDYSLFRYGGNNKKGVCRCGVCGYVWETVPMSLFKNHGCPECAKMKKSLNLTNTTDGVIKKFRETHGDRYDYSKVIYINDKTKVEIVCKEHGSFWQTPSSHIQGRGCPKCSGGINLTQEEFEERMSKKYKDIDFSEFKYVNAFTPGKCKCKICSNVWETTYSSLIHAIVGCPECATNSRKLKRTDTLELFIKKYKEKYPENNYDFSKSEYVNSLTKFNVVCKKHGEFSVRPNQLMSGCGCPRCNDSKLEKLIREKLTQLGIYFIQGGYYDWIVNPDTKHKMTLDFYIPNKKIAIECQGVQHFAPIDIFGGEMTLKENIFKDTFKKEACVNNGVELVYFLDEKYNGFMKHDDVFFNNIDALVQYILEREVDEE